MSQEIDTANKRQKTADSIGTKSITTNDTKHAVGHGVLTTTKIKEEKHQAGINEKKDKPRGHPGHSAVVHSPSNEDEARTRQNMHNNQLQEATSQRMGTHPLRCHLVCQSTGLRATQ